MAEDRSADWYARQAGEILPEAYVDHVPVNRIRLPDKKSYARSAYFYRYLHDLVRNPEYRPDLIQLVHDLPFDCVRFSNSIHRTSTSLVYAYTLPPKGSSNPIKRLLQRYLLRRNFDALDCVIANSSANRDQLFRWGVKSRIEVILNGVDLGQFHPAEDAEAKKALRRELSLPVHDPIILSVGAVHPRKGTDLLLNAWKEIAHKLPNARLYSIGMRHDLKNPKLAQFRRLIEDLTNATCAADRIHFSGYVANVPDYLRAADLLIFPSRIEGMPNAVIEAMASGLPVLTCPFVGLSSDLGKPNIDFMLVEHDRDALAAAAIQVLTEHDLWRKLSLNGRKWVVQTMDRERTLDRYAALYFELASAAKPR
jgi:glycosyltransferase involved in cell wall biosynthesis